MLMKEECQSMNDIISKNQYDMDFIDKKIKKACQMS